MRGGTRRFLFAPIDGDGKWVTPRFRPRALLSQFELEFAKPQTSEDRIAITRHAKKQVNKITAGKTDSPAPIDKVSNTPGDSLNTVSPASNNQTASA